MTRERVSIFGDDADPSAADLGVGDFSPRKRGAGPRPNPDQIKEVAQAAGFTPRQPLADPAPRRQRRHRTGRTEQINFRATADYRDRFVAIADRLGLSLAEAFERSVEALQREVDRD